MEWKIRGTTCPPRLHNFIKCIEVASRELFKLCKYVERGDLLQEQVSKKNAISTVYDELQEKRKYSDTTDLMVEINRIVSDAITVTKDGEPLVTRRRFDINSIDFGRLQQEFARIKNKNLLIKDLKDLVEERPHKMMKSLQCLICSAKKHLLRRK